MFYDKNIFPVLTPLSVDSGHPFPFLSNLSISLGIFLKHPDRDEELFARIKIPTHFPNWIRVDGGKNPKRAKYVSLIEIILSNLNTVFHGMEIIDVMPFRITRNTNIETDDDESDDLMEMISEELKERKFGDIVRLEYWGKPNENMLDILKEFLTLDDDQIYEVKGLLEYSSLKPIWELHRPELKYQPWVPVAPAAFSDPERDIFQIIKQ